MQSTSVLLPTTVTGSHAIPSWVTVALEAIAAGRFGRYDIRETLDDAVIAAIGDQERAGLDIISDGEMRRQDFIMGFYERLTGLEPAEPARKIGVNFYDTEKLHRVVGPVTAPNGLGIVEEFEFARTVAQRPLKVPVPGPLTLTTPLKLAAGYSGQDELVADLVRIVNDELQRLVAAGASFIQIDEPAFHPWFPTDPRRVLEVFNAAVDGVNAKIAIHICFGNRVGRPRNRRSYQPYFPLFHEFKAEQFVLEFANRELSEIELWREYGGDRELGAGLIDQKSFYLETPEDVAERIRQVLQYVPAEKLYINPDCGLNYTPRWLAVSKLRHMVEGARIVRAALSG